MNLHHGTLTVNGSYDNDNALLDISGSNAAEIPVIALDGGTSTIPNVYVGNGHNGVLNVVGGATLSTSTLTVGLNSGGNGTVSISGANSKIQLTGGGKSYIGGGGGLSTTPVREQKF